MGCETTCLTLFAVECLLIFQSLVVRLLLLLLLLQSYKEWKNENEAIGIGFPFFFLVFVSTVDRHSIHALRETKPPPLSLPPPPLALSTQIPLVVGRLPTGSEGDIPFAPLLPSFYISFAAFVGSFFLSFFLSCFATWSTVNLFGIKQQATAISQSVNKQSKENLKRVVVVVVCYLSMYIRALF